MEAPEGAYYLDISYIYYYNGTRKRNLIKGCDIMDETIYGDIYTVDTSDSTVYCG